MRYCNSCVLPNTRPGVVIDPDGVCVACKNTQKKKTEIPWENRAKAFSILVSKVKAKSHGYDCVIPVSGGKDSTWQVVKCLEFGLNPLTVTWRTPGRTSIGQKNLDNLIRLGVDHIDYSINPEVEKKFMLLALEKYGSTAIPMHMAIFNIPTMIAVRFGIPLIIWGENSAFEYGTDDEELSGSRLDNKWLEKFGVTHGTTAENWVSEKLTRKELSPYFGPEEKELSKKDVSGIFLGYYFNWDVETSLNIAKKHGFQVRQEGAKTGYYNFADIDDHFISIHHFIKWYKFGITRTFDNLSLEIRNKRLSRDEAIKILLDRGLEIPHEDISRLCAFVNIPEENFWKILEKFRNKEIWRKIDGVWKIQDFLIPTWKWN